MKTKENEIKGLKPEVGALIEELEKFKRNYNVSKNTEALGMIRETIISLKAQIEEDKKTKENLTIQLLKKEGSCHLLELDVKDLRKKEKNENIYIKFKDSSTILDKILYSQR